ncbi:MAG: SMP-30/gluconolactonase/LRE family protein [Chloroflexi bacterium]|nr:SMP-30/gluconolactonase/LRE family protein [Chloroflexota bacterium]MCL5273774.1 SMP-30/gluconolactonase/LRE family protein [Chloroflexota bacterium]
MEPQLIADYACVVGEGPMWHPYEKKVYWVDIVTGRMFRYDPATQHHEQIYQGDPIGGYTIQDDGALLLFMNKGAVKIWREGALKTVIDEIPDERETRFNDVFADPVGRVFCGTMPTADRKGRLYRLDTDGKLTILLEGIGTSNGMGLTPDRKHLYYTDSEAHSIYIFDYDQASGSISNQRIFKQTPPQEGLPDGMTVDAEGCVWSAHWDGGFLVRFSPAGEELMRIQFPARKVSSVIFGGDDYTDMYVTTAGGDHKETDGPLAGSLFKLNLGIRGVPEFFSRIKAS